SASRSTISRLGLDRPVSTKLRCRAETSASRASSSWLIRRRCLQSRSNVPTWYAAMIMLPSCASGTMEATTCEVIVSLPCTGHHGIHRAGTLGWPGARTTRHGGHMDTTALVERYFGTWNETDPARRREAIAEVWTEDGRYQDPVQAAEG